MGKGGCRVATVSTPIVTSYSSSLMTLMPPLCMENTTILLYKYIHMQYIGSLGEQLFSGK